MPSPFGIIRATNITPDPQFGIGRYSEEEFDRAVRHGVRNDGTRLYPAMPYTSFSKLSREDSRALYAYFQRAVKPDPNRVKPTALPFPFNQRWGMAAWNTLFAPPEGFTPDSSRSETWNHGAWLVQGPGHCGECHTRRRVMGQLATYSPGSSAFLAGGTVDGWYAPSLRGAGSGATNVPLRSLARWSPDELRQFLMTGRNTHAGVIGEMSLVISHSLSRLPKSDIDAMIEFLASYAPVSKRDSAVSPEAHEKAIAGTQQVLQAGKYGLDSGERLYMDNCAACHFGTGQGAPTVFPALAANPIVVAPNAKGLIWTILDGAAMPSTELAPAKLRMPDFGWRLYDAEVASLATFIRSAWGNHASAVSARDVAKVRAEIESLKTGPQGASAEASTRSTPAR